VPPSNPTDFLAILRVLCAYHVDFIVVGGVGAVLQGAEKGFSLTLADARGSVRSSKSTHAVPSRDRQGAQSSG
jgi:hypothetical protein